MSQKDVTIVLTPEAQEQYKKAITAIYEAERWAADALNQRSSSLVEAEALEKEAQRRSEMVARMRSSLHAQWGVLTTHHSTYDGALRIMADAAPLSWFFRYESGYHGGLIFHPTHENGERLPVGTWSVHT